MLIFLWALGSSLLFQFYSSWKKTPSALTWTCFMIVFMAPLLGLWLLRCSVEHPIFKIPCSEVAYNNTSKYCTKQHRVYLYLSWGLTIHHIAQFGVRFQKRVVEVELTLHPCSWNNIVLKASLTHFEFF